MFKRETTSNTPEKPYEKKFYKPKGMMDYRKEIIELKRKVSFLFNELKLFDEYDIYKAKIEEQFNG